MLRNDLMLKFRLQPKYIIIFNRAKEMNRCLLALTMLKYKAFLFL